MSDSELLKELLKRIENLEASLAEVIEMARRADEYRIKWYAYWGDRSFR